MADPPDRAPPVRLPGVSALAALAAAAAAQAPPRRSRAEPAPALAAIADVAAAQTRAPTHQVGQAFLREAEPAAFRAPPRLASYGQYSEWAPPPQAALPPVHSLHSASYDGRESSPWSRHRYTHSDVAPVHEQSHASAEERRNAETRSRDIRLNFAEPEVPLRNSGHNHRHGFSSPQDEPDQNHDRGDGAKLTRVVPLRDQSIERGDLPREWSQYREDPNPQSSHALGDVRGLQSRTSTTPSQPYYYLPITVPLGREERSVELPPVHFGQRRGTGRQSFSGRSERDERGKGGSQLSSSYSRDHAERNLPPAPPIGSMSTGDVLDSSAKSVGPEVESRLPRTPRRTDGKVASPLPSMLTTLCSDPVARGLLHSRSFPVASDTIAHSVFHRESNKRIPSAPLVALAELALSEPVCLSSQARPTLQPDHEGHRDLQSSASVSHRDVQSVASLQRSFDEDDEGQARQIPKRAPCEAGTSGANMDSVSGASEPWKQSTQQPTSLKEDPSYGSTKDQVPADAKCSVTQSERNARDGYLEATEDFRGFQTVSLHSGEALAVSDAKLPAGTGEHVSQSAMQVTQGPRSSRPASEVSAAPTEEYPQTKTIRSLVSGESAEEHASEIVDMERIVKSEVDDASVLNHEELDSGEAKCVSAGEEEERVERLEVTTTENERALAQGHRPHNVLRRAGGMYDKSSNLNLESGMHRVQAENSLPVEPSSEALPERMPSVGDGTVPGVESECHSESFLGDGKAPRSPEWQSSPKLSSRENEIRHGSPRFRQSGAEKDAVHSHSESDLVRVEGRGESIRVVPDAKLVSSPKLALGATDVCSPNSSWDNQETRAGKPGQQLEKNIVNLEASERRAEQRTDRVSSCNGGNIDGNFKQGLIEQKTGGDSDVALDEGKEKRKEKSKNKERRKTRGRHSSSKRGEITRCPCGSVENLDFMVACDQCDTWQHGKCMGIRRQAEVTEKKYYCHICRPDEVRPRCIAHPRYKERQLAKDRERSSREFDPALSGVKPLELRRLFSSDLKIYRHSPKVVDLDDLFRRYASLFRSQFGKDKQSVIEGLVVVTELPRLDVQHRLESVLRKMRGSGSRSATGLDVASTTADCEIKVCNSSPSRANTPTPGGGGATELSFGDRPSRELSEPDVQKAGHDELPREVLGGSSYSHEDSNDNQGRGKRCSTKSGSKRPRPPSLQSIGIQPMLGDESMAVASGPQSEAEAGCEVPSVAGGRFLSREDRKIQEIMRVFQRIDEQNARGKKRPRMASAADSPKHPQLDSPVARPAAAETSREVRELSENIARPPLSLPGKVCREKDVRRREKNVSDASPRSGSAPAKVDVKPDGEEERLCSRRPENSREVTEGRVVDVSDREERSRPHFLERPSGSPKAPLTNSDEHKTRPPFPLVTPEPVRKQPGNSDLHTYLRRKADRDRSGKERVSSATHRDRPRRRNSDTGPSPRVGAPVLSTSRTLAKTSLGSSRVDSGCALNPMLLFRFDPPGPSVLRSQLVPRSRRSHIENEEEARNIQTMKNKRKLRCPKKEWIAASVPDLVENVSRSEALPAKKQWLYSITAEDSLGNASTAVGTDECRRESLRISMVVVSRKDSLPDGGRQLESSFLEHSDHVSDPSGAGVHRSSRLKGMDCENDFLSVDEQVRRAIVSARPRAQSQCLKKRLDMFYPKESVAKNPSLPLPRSAPFPSSTKSPLLRLRSAPLPTASLATDSTSPRPPPSASTSILGDSEKGERFLVGKKTSDGLTSKNPVPIKEVQSSDRDVAPHTKAKPGELERAAIDGRRDAKPTERHLGGASSMSIGREGLGGRDSATLAAPEDKLASRGTNEEIPRKFPGGGEGAIGSRRPSFERIPRLSQSKKLKSSPRPSPEHSRSPAAKIERATASPSPRRSALDARSTRAPVVRFRSVPESAPVRSARQSSPVPLSQPVRHLQLGSNCRYGDVSSKVNPDKRILGEPASGDGRGEKGNATLATPKSDGRVGDSRKHVPHEKVPKSEVPGMSDQMTRRDTPTTDTSSRIHSRFQEDYERKETPDARGGRNLRRPTG